MRHGLLDCEGGRKRADQIQVGDLLWSRPEGEPDAKAELKPVEEVFVRTSPVLTIRVAGQAIRTTAEHPFWVQGEGWLPAAFLRPGDLLRTRGGLLIAVEGVENNGEVETVYNWRIGEYHTYYVSAVEDGVSLWVHNAYTESGDKGDGDGPPPIRRKPQTGSSRPTGKRRSPPRSEPPEILDADAVKREETAGGVTRKRPTPNEDLTEAGSTERACIRKRGTSKQNDADRTRLEGELKKQREIINDQNLPEPVRDQAMEDAKVIQEEINRIAREMQRKQRRWNNG